MEEAKSRYMMVGVFTIPVARKSKELVPLLPGLGEILVKEKVAVEEGDLEGPLLPEWRRGEMLFLDTLMGIQGTSRNGRRW